MGRTQRTVPCVLAVVVDQQILPRAGGGIGVVGRALDGAQRTGGVGVPLHRRDIARVVVFVPERGVLGDAVVADKLVLAVVGGAGELLPPFWGEHREPSPVFRPFWENTENRPLCS